MYVLLERKYYFDDLWIKGFAGGGRKLGDLLWKRGDQFLIDGVLVNGTANTVGRLAGVLRQLQSGYLYHLRLRDDHRADDVARLAHLVPLGQGSES